MRKVAVVGGGLAGMAAALALVRQGDVEVQLIEASDRLGGMAGASEVDGKLEDHGYHIFPLWYENIHQILRDLGLESTLHNVEKFQQLRRGEFPTFRALKNMTSLRFVWTNLWSRTHPFLDLALFYYSVVDLICQPHRLRSFLDQTSIYGFIRYRFYRTDAVADLYQDLLLKFLSVPSYKLSSMAVRTMLSYWVVQGVPTCRILPTDMETSFIAPWRRDLERRGCKVLTSARLTRIRLDGKRVASIEYARAGGTETAAVDDLVLALSPRTLAQVLDDPLFATAPDLSRVNYLRTEAMASLSLYLTEKIAGLPPEHVNLLESRFALTFIDVSQHWTGHDKTLLNVIASDINELQGISDQTAVEEILRELQQYLPFLSRDKVARLHFQSHFGEPLVMNEVGAWHFRSGATTGVANLYVAGTHCRSHIDMTSMEGAVVTGLLAANELLLRNGLDGLYVIRQPPTARRWLFQLLRAVLFPGVLIAKGWILLRQLLTASAPLSTPEAASTIRKRRPA